MVSSGKNISNIEDSKNAAADIFAEYGDFIYNVICTKASNKAQVDDLYQDFFLSLVSNPVDPDLSNIKGYLYRAITNDIIDASRRTQRYQKIIHNYSNNSNFTVNESASIDAIDNEGGIEGMFKLARGFLSPTEMQALTLRCRDNCDNDEIAEIMGIKKESVSRYICIGLRKIRQILAVEEYK